MLVIFWCKFESLAADCHQPKLKITVTARISAAWKTLCDVLFLNCFQIGLYVFSAILQTNETWSIRTVDITKFF